MEPINHCSLPEETSNNFKAILISTSQCPDHLDWEVIKIFDGENCTELKVVNMENYVRTDTNISCNGAVVLLYQGK